MIGQFYYAKAVVPKSEDSLPVAFIKSSSELMVNPTSVLLEHQGVFTLIPIEYIKEAIDYIKTRQKLDKVTGEWAAILRWEMGTPVSAKFARILLAGSNIGDDNIDNQAANRS